MKHLILAACALALSGCATMGASIGPRPGETPCAYGRRVLDETQRRLEQARLTAETVCTVAGQ
jgi:uncharacterized protein YceK